MLLKIYHFILPIDIKQRYSVFNKTNEIINFETIFDTVLLCPRRSCEKSLGNRL